MNRQTTLAKNQEVPQDWWVVDATDLILGRLSSKIAMMLMGKHKPQYTPHALTGDAVVVLNCDKVKLTGRKAAQKNFQTYVFYPGGQKNFTYEWMLANRPELLFERAVRRIAEQGLMGDGGAAGQAAAHRGGPAQEGHGRGLCGWCGSVARRQLAHSHVAFIM